MNEEIFNYIIFINYLKTTNIINIIKNIIIFKSNMTTVSFNSTPYYLVDEIKKQDALFFRGCSKSLRHVVEKRNIPNEEVLYASFSVKNGWSVADKENLNNKAKLFISQEWADANTNMGKKVDNVDSDYITAPPLLELDESEKFKGVDGKSLDIETRGTKTEEGIYFKANDVGKIFGIKDIRHTIKKDSYVRGVHYETFIKGVGADVPYPSDKQNYLTYEGMITLLYRCNSSNAKIFRKWATTILFTHQMGTVEQKRKLASKLTGIPLEQLRETIKMSGGKVSCVYLLNLGKAGDLRDVMRLDESIDDDQNILKFGMTSDMTRRLYEHKTQTFKDIPEITVLKYAFIDAKFIKEAEDELKQIFNVFINYKNAKEVVATRMDEYWLERLNDKFKIISLDFKGQAAGIINQIEQIKMGYEAKIKDLQRDLKYEIDTRDLIITNKDMENENLRLKLRIAELSG